MKRPLCVLAVGILLWGCSEPVPEELPPAGAAKVLGLPQGKFDPDADPTADLAEAVALARTSNRRIILDVGGEWCSWCHILDNFIAARLDLGTSIAHDFVWLKINFSPQNENKAFLSKYPRIPGYPHLFVLSEKGDLLHSQDTSQLEQGQSYDLAKMKTFFATWAKK